MRVVSLSKYDKGITHRAVQYYIFWIRVTYCLLHPMTSLHKDLGFRRQHGSRRVYLALNGLNGRSGDKVGAITPEDVLAIPCRPKSDDQEDSDVPVIRLLDVLDMLPRRFTNDGDDRSIVVDFGNTLYSITECLQADQGIAHHPIIDDPHMAEAAFEDPVPEVFSFAIDSEIEVFLPKSACTELCSAIVSRLAYQFTRMGV